MNDNDKKVKEYLEKEEVPEKISPDNIKIMLDENKPAEKRKNISAVGRFAAIAAACAVIVGGAAALNGKLSRNNISNPTTIIDESSSGSVENSGNSETQEAVEKISYMNGAESYEQVYKMFKAEQKKNKRKDSSLFTFAEKNDLQSTDMIAEEAVESAVVPAAEDESLISNSDMEAGGQVSDTVEFSDTYNQEENVLEADIVKTDGKNIYHLSNNGKNPKMNVVAVDNGSFTNSFSVDVTPDMSYFEDKGDSGVNVLNMYLYNDMIEVVGYVNCYASICTDDSDYYDFYNYYDKSKCFVSFYTKSENPELIGTYFQDGYYSDVRISPEGYMYLVSTKNNISIGSLDDSSRIEDYIPSCGVNGDIKCLEPQDILLPAEPQENDYLNYTIISSIDLNTPSEYSVCDTKALAGYIGKLYSSANNIYTTVGWEDTNITRISIEGGSITPEASNTVEGVVKDQFSMSEYNGYFRIATTIDKYEYKGNFITEALNIDSDYEHISDNRVYVLDMDLNEVGRVQNFGENESIKSVNFSGDMGYVVTYERTDPLFAIDLSDPANPFITNEFKINGYSTYMQKWDDGLLLGFGVNADENAIETGVKIVMFDNSDPYDLKEVGFCSIDRNPDENEYIHSNAVYDRKALLIAPEKNLIGFPLYMSRYSVNEDSYVWEDESKYVFFSYENGEFIKKGELLCDEYEHMLDEFERAVYIGDYVYAISYKGIVSADIDTLTMKDKINFTEE